MLWVCIGVCGTIGGLIPLLWGSDDMFVSILLSTVGGIVGIWIWYKLFRFS